MKIDQKFLDSLLEWQQAGRRSIKIEVDNLRGTQRRYIFAYDYDLSYGTPVDETTDIPCLTETIKQAKIKRLQEELGKLS